MNDELERKYSYYEKEICDKDNYIKFLEEKLEKKEILNTEDLMQMFGVIKTTIDRYKREKNLPYHKFGRTSPVYYIKQEVEEWAKKNFKVK